MAHLPDSLEHAAHPSHEENLLLQDFATAAFGLNQLRLFVLLNLLLLEDGLNVGCLHRLAALFVFVEGGELGGVALLHEVLHHISNLLHEEGDGPFEKIHALGQVERVYHILVLFDVHFVVLDQDHCSLVVVLSAVVWRAENSDDGGEGLVTTPSVHLVAINLDLMGLDN